MHMGCWALTGNVGPGVEWPQGGPGDAPGTGNRSVVLLTFGLGAQVTPRSSTHAAQNGHAGRASKRWRPPDKPMSSHVRCSYARGYLPRRRTHHARRGGGNQRWGNDEQPRGAEVARRSTQIRCPLGPERDLSTMHARCVTGGFGPIGDLLRPMLHPVHDRANHSTRNDRHEQEPDRYVATVRHGDGRPSVQIRDLYSHPLP